MITKVIILLITVIMIMIMTRGKNCERHISHCLETNQESPLNCGLIINAIDSLIVLQSDR